nr:hypothetical protein [Tanacetum cinerariifolium]
FPPTDRSDSTHEEFADELAHIISPPEYDCFYFRDLLDLGDWISSLNSRIHENLSSTTCVNLPVEDNHSPLLAYVVWIFLAYLTLKCLIVRTVWEFFIELLWIVVQDKMSRDVIIVGSTVCIPLLYWGVYSQWRQRFMNYLEEQTDSKAMINSIQNGDQPLPVIAQVSLAGTAQNAPPTLKDPKQMHSSEYGEQDRKAVILYEYETFKANEGEQLLATYLRYLQVINDLKKCGYKKDNCELNYKFLNNLQSECKQYGTLMRQTKNLMDINIDALYNILKQNQGDVNDALGYKKKAVVVTSDPLALVAEKTNKIIALLAKAFNRRKFYSKPTNNNLRTSSTSQSANKKQEFVKSDDKKVEKKADEKKRDMSKVKCYNCKKEGHFAKDCKKAKEINANMVFMTQIKKVLSESDESSSSAEETIAEVAYYTFESETKSEFETSEYYDKSTNYGLFVNNDYDQEIFHDAIESASENFIDNLIDSQKDYDKSEVNHNDSEEKEHLVDKDLKNTILDKDFKISELEECVRNKDLEIKNCLERLNVCENKIHKMSQTNQTVHMIMASKDILYNGRKWIGFENPRYFEKAKDLRPSLYDEKVIGLGYTLMFLTHFDEALEIKKFKRSRENKIEFAYDYVNLNASYVNEKINFKDDYFQEIINPDFKKIDSPFQQTSSLKPYVPNVILEKIIIDLEGEVVNLLEKEKENLETIESLKSKGFESSENVISKTENQSENDCQVVEKECDKMENPKVIAPGTFKLRVSQCVSPISITKTSCASKNVESKLKRKRRKRKSSKQNVKQVNNDVLRANSDFVHLSDLDTFSSVRRPKHSGVVWKKKWSSNTSNVDLFSDSHLKLNT